MSDEEITDGWCVICRVSGEAGYVCLNCNLSHHVGLKMAPGGERISSAAIFQPYIGVGNKEKRNCEFVILIKEELKK